MPIRSIARAAALAAVTSVAAGNLALAQTTTDSQPRYSAWGDQADTKLEELLDSLDGLVDAATKAKAADPVFLQDLRNLSAKYRTPAAPVAQAAPGPIVRLLSDNFADGNYTANPVWKVSAGSYWIESSGTYTGLRSSIAAAATSAQSGNLAAAVLGAILQPQSPGTGSGAKHASIYTALPISNAFTLKLEMSSKFTGGRLDFGPYQGASGNYAYRVAYFPGAKQSLQLLKLTPQGSTVIGAYDNVLNLEDKRRHVIDWTRDAAGMMTVALDGRKLITATDLGLKDPFTGFLVINSGGDYAIRSIAIDGTN